MISAIIGSPGSGKSTCAAWICKKALKRPGKPVYLCGMPISAGHSQLITNFYYPGALKLQWDLLGRTYLKDALIVIDEIMLLADSRNFKTFSEDLKYFFSQHRKDDLSLVYLTQSWDDVDKKIRNLTTKYFILRPLPFDMYRVDSVNHYVDIEQARIVCGFQYGRSSFFFGRPIYRLFNSFAKINRTESTEPYPSIPWNQN